MQQVDPNLEYTIIGLSDAELADVQRRFSEKVEPDRETGCINWTGFTDDKGYGKFRVGPNVCRAHRVSYEIAYGPIPPEHVIRHQCNNPRCVNPEHLIPGTQQDNMDDMTETLRGHSKFTNKDVATIWGMRILGWTPNQIAAELSASPTTIRYILRGDRRPDALDRELDKDLARRKPAALAN